ncbi:MAG: biopolymer transporter ExbD [Planctomycetes bacterium]|nr:biopolymer transporter ExbD [Planctomycetota bacterium]
MKPRRRRNAVNVPVASMGDIAFLLIIFFMVCSNFIKESSIRLQPPRAADLRALKETPVTVSISAEGEIFLQGQRVPDAQAIEWGVAALIKDKATPEGRTVVFKCDQKMGKEVFEPVLDSIAKAGALVAAMGEETQ